MKTNNHLLRSIIKRKKRIKKGLIILIFYIILFANTMNLFCRTSINDIKIIDSNSIIFYFNEIPPTYTSALSSDKFQIVINIINADFNDAHKETIGTGFFKDIYLKRIGNDVAISIRCKDRTGYTAVALPYSKSILIETFNWAKLKKHEENLRSGLLAFEDGLSEPAKKFLTLSAESGNADAATHLGIIQLYEGKLKSACKNLLFANSLQSKIPDNYAALAQIFKQYDMPEKYNDFLTKFTNLSGVHEFPYIVIGEIPPEDSLDKETLESLLKIYIEDVQKEEALSDTLNSKFDKVLSGDKEIQKGLIESLFPDWFIEYMIYILVIFLMVIGFIYFSFRKWKVQQIKINLENEKVVRLKPDFDDELKSANNSISKVENLTKIYKSNEINEKTSDNMISVSQNKIGKTKQTGIINKKEIIQTTKRESPSLKETSKIEEPENEAFGEKIDRLAKQLIAAQKQQSLEEYEQELEDLQNQKKEGLDAKSKLAMHLQEKDFLLKQSNLANLGEIPNDDKKIKDIAKNMKVEKAAIDAKKDFNKLTEDKKTFQDLKKKFETKQNNYENPV